MTKLPEDIRQYNGRLIEDLCKLGETVVDESTKKPMQGEGHFISPERWRQLERERDMGRDA